MTERVDFYVLKSATAKQRWAFACRLTEKAYLRDLRVVIVNDTLEPMRRRSMTCCGRSTTAPSCRTSICHGWARARIRRTPVHARRCEPAATRGRSAGESRALACPRIGSASRASPKSSTPTTERRRLGRERFKTYRDLKLALETHQLDDAAEI